MAKVISASNAVVSSIEQAAMIYGVRSYRMNTRTFQVVGAGGRERPMFMGQWRDRFGTIHFKGMGDLLMTPFVPVAGMCVALWCECKAGTGRLTGDQQLFREDVEEAGASYLLAHDGPDVVIEWFQKMGVRR